jgi:methylmalonyl-CoA mutase cobalamin-binding subunit
MSSARAGLADAFDRADELAHDLGLLGVAEIEVVGGGQRPAPTAQRLRQASATACLPPSTGLARRSAA